MSIGAIKSRLLALQEDVETHAAARREAVGNYERELQLHAADAQALSDTRRSHSVIDGARKKARLSNEALLCALSAHCSRTIRLLVFFLVPVHSISVANHSLTQFIYSRFLTHQAEQDVAAVTAKFMAAEGAFIGEKVALERAVEELTSRCNDLTRQNTLLHAQLDKLAATAQRVHDAHAVAIVATMEQNNAKSKPSEGNTAVGELGSTAVSSVMVGQYRGGTSNSTDDKEVGAHSISALLEVVRYLRREKEVACCQRELKIQESARLAQQLSVARRTADELRVQLQREAERGAKELASEADHARLLAGVQENTLLRESNLQLREQERRAADRATTADASIVSLKAELAPLKTTVRLLEAAKKALDADKAALIVERDRYAKRMNDVVEKYHQVDPAEHNKLKRQLGKVRTELTATMRNLDVARAQHEAVKAEASEATGKLDISEKARREVREQLESAEKGVTRFREALKKYRTLLQEKTEKNKQLIAMAEDREIKMKEFDATVREKSATIKQLTAKLEDHNKTIGRLNTGTKAEADVAPPTLGTMPPLASPRVETTAASVVAMKRKADVLTTGDAAPGESARPGAPMAKRARPISNSDVGLESDPALAAITSTKGHKLQFDGTGGQGKADHIPTPALPGTKLTAPRFSLISGANDGQAGGGTKADLEQQLAAAEARKKQRRQAKEAATSVAAAAAAAAVAAAPMVAPNDQAEPGGKWRGGGAGFGISATAALGVLGKPTFTFGAGSFTGAESDPTAGTCTTDTPDTRNTRVGSMDTEKIKQNDGGADKE